MYRFCLILAVVSANVSAYIICDRICPTSNCLLVSTCPPDLVLERSVCGCCSRCVSPLGGMCDFPGISCKNGTWCCNGKCIPVSVMCPLAK